MKAVRYHPDVCTIRVDDIPIPKPREDDILVRTIASGLCHSDLVHLATNKTCTHKYGKLTLAVETHRLSWTITVPLNRLLLLSWAMKRSARSSALDPKSA